MGVLNVTPDSFSDGGRYLEVDTAIARGFELVAEGADLVDVGGESTRPGASPVAPADELARIEPVIRALAPVVRVSVDTRHAEVADAALTAGATLLNDVSASLWPVAARHGAGWVAVHMAGTPTTMQDDPRYHDVVAEVTAFLVGRAEAALAGGVGEVWIDPGIGFGKRPEHNLALLAGVRILAATGHPVLVGTSRKGFLGGLTGGAPVDDRLEASLASAVWAMSQGAGMVRVHDVAPTVQAATLVGSDVAAPVGSGQ